jgi:hypothetical protein
MSSEESLLDEGIVRYLRMRRGVRRNRPRAPIAVVPEAYLNSVGVMLWAVLCEDRSKNSQKRSLSIPSRLPYISPNTRIAGRTKAKHAGLLSAARCESIHMAARRASSGPVVSAALDARSHQGIADTFVQLSQLVAFDLIAPILARVRSRRM